eukprot:scaffold17093_cov51-Phaeocystis_antarctica.AAC.2
MYKGRGGEARVSFESRVVRDRVRSSNVTSRSSDSAPLHGRTGAGLQGSSVLVGGTGRRRGAPGRWALGRD